MGLQKPNIYEKVLKTRQPVYQETVLKDMGKPLGQTLFQIEPWTFLQNQQPAHKTR